MATNISTVATTNTFDYWRQRTNDAITALNTQTVMVGSNTISGNAVVNGHMQVVGLVVNSLAGSSSVGTTGTVNTTFANLTITTGLVVANQSWFSQNLTVNTTLLISTSTTNTTIGSNYLKFSNSTVTFQLNPPTAAQNAAGSYFLSSNGSWQVLSTSVPGSDTQVIFNDGGATSGNAGLTFTKTGNTLTVGTKVVTGNSTVNASLTTAGMQINGTQVVNTTNFVGTSNNSTNFAGQAQSYYANVSAPVFTTSIRVGTGATNVTINTTAFSGTANNSLYLGGTAAADYVTDTELSTTLGSYVTTSALSTTLGPYVQNTDSRTLSGNLNFTGANNNFTQTLKANALVSNTYVQTANVQMVSADAGRTLQASDSGTVVTVNSASAQTITVPAGLPVGFRCMVTRLGAGSVTASASGTTLNSRTGTTAIATQYGSISIFCYATNSFVIDGNL